MKLRIVALSVIMVCVGLQNLPAQEETPHSGNPFTKLSSGVAQIGLSWVEIPLQIKDYSKRYGVVPGTLVGFAGGIGMGVLDVVEGVFTSSTFMFKPYDINKEFYERIKMPEKRAVLEKLDTQQEIVTQPQAKVKTNASKKSGNIITWLFDLDKKFHEVLW